MSYEIASLITLRLLMLSLFLQGIEMIFIFYRKDFFEIWSYENLKTDLEAGLPLPRSVTKFLFSTQVFQFVILFQIIFAGVSAFFPSLWMLVLLFVFQLMISIRFRGTFNGGSDMMSFVVLTGLLITALAPTLETQKLGLIYIAIHCTYSYFKAGLAKLVQPDWRQGQALSAFLKRSLFPDVQHFSTWLQKKYFLSCIASWGTVFFEISFFALIFFPKLVFIYFLLALVFHFAIYISFGLNRFFWIWLSAWPSLFFASSYLQNR